MSQQEVPMDKFPRPHTDHGHRWAAFRVPGAKAGDLTLISVYGYPHEGPSARNRAIIREVATFAGGLQGAHWLVGGDWNLTPEEFVQAGGGRPWHRSLHWRAHLFSLAWGK